MKKGYLILIFLILSFLIGKTQELNFHQYTTKNGLPSSEVYDIIQDNHGFIWFATDHGLSRYDGYNFENFDTRDGLTNNVVFKFTKDDYGKIWCTTFNNNVFSIQGIKPFFTPYKYNNIIKKAINDDYSCTMKKIKIDSLNNFYFTFEYFSGYLKIDKNGITENNLTISFDTKKFLFYVQHHLNYFFTLEYKTPHKLPKDINFSFERTYESKSDFYKKFDGIYFPKVQNLFCIHQDEIIGLINKKDTIKIKRKNEALHIGKLDENYFWVSSFTGGVDIYSNQGKFIKKIFEGITATKVYVDHEHSIWISTLRNGVFHITNTNVFVKKLGDVEQRISQLEKDHNNVIWIAMENGYIYRLNKKQILKHHNSETGRPSYLYFDETKNSMYFHSNKHIFTPEKKKFFVGSPIKFMVNTALFKDSIILLSYRGLHIKGEKVGRVIKGYRVHDLYCYNEQPYLGTKSGLAKLINDSIHLIDTNEQLLTTRIDDLDKVNDQLVLATKGVGIVLYDEDTIININSDKGLSSNFINNMYVENDSTLWACTNNGLNRIIFKKHNTYSIKEYNFANGLISNEVSDVVVLNDTVWVGTREGLCFFEKSKYDISNDSTSYFLTLNNLKINDKKHPISQSLELDYNSNRIEFSYSGKSFNEANRLLYRYKLKGLETNWTYTEKRKALYASLNPGKYTFIVQVKGKNKNWRQQACVNIFITPPFWTTWWFIVLIIAIVSTLVYLFFKFRVLVYNRDILRELLRLIMRKLTSPSLHIVVRDSNKDVKIKTKDITYVKSDRNYLEINTIKGKYVIREKISNFRNMVPDPLEFIQIRRSFIIRIDHVSEKGKKHVVVNHEKIEVGKTYLDQLDKINL